MYMCVSGGYRHLLCIYSGGSIDMEMEKETKMEGEEEKYKGHEY